MKKQEQVRLSMKLLDKIMFRHFRKFTSAETAGIGKFLFIVESEMKSPKKPLLTNKEVC